jgi:capsular exopolysaccharide synthesis family protein
MRFGLMDGQSSYAVLWRRKWIILATVALTVGAAVLFTLRSPKTYEATGLLRVESVNTGNTDPTAVNSVQQASQGQASSDATLLKSSGMLARIRSRVGGGHLKLSELQSRVKADVISVNNQPTNLVQLTTTGRSPESARALAGDIARAFVDVIQKDANRRIAQQKTAIESQISSLTDRIQAARARGANGAEQIAPLIAARNGLTAQEATLIANGIASSNSVSPAADPTASSAPVSPRPLFNALVAGLLGLVAGVGLAWARERLDVGLHNSDEAVKLLEAPKLATIPILKSAAKASTDGSLTGEAYDVLRTNLVFMGVDQPLQTITFTSYNPGEGKSSVVAGLGRAAQRAGARVLMIDCDLRTGSLSQRVLGKSEKPGVTNLIVHDMRASAKSKNGAEQLVNTIVPLGDGLSLLPAGPLPPNPTGMLSSDSLAKLMESLRADYDLILIDSPPVANLADASLLASLSDGVVLIARVGLTKRKDLQSAIEGLRHSPTAIVGAVVLERQSPGAAYYPPATRERLDTREARRSSAVS